MDISVRTRALIPTRLIADAAHESSRRALGRLRKHVNNIRVTVTDRRIRPGTVCCEVEVHLARGTAIVVRSVSANPVEAVSQAFDNMARSILRRLLQERTRRHVTQYPQMYARRSRDPQPESSLNRGHAR